MSIELALVIAVGVPVALLGSCGGAQGREVAT